MISRVLEMISSAIDCTKKHRAAGLVTVVVHKQAAVPAVRSVNLYVQVQVQLNLHVHALHMTGPNLHWCQIQRLAQTRT